jgi:hypothetical protein
LLRDMKDRGERDGGHGDRRSGSQATTPKLDDLGVTKSQPSRWQRLASLSAEKQEEVILPAPHTAAIRSCAYSLGRLPPLAAVFARALQRQGCALGVELACPRRPPFRRRADPSIYRWLCRWVGFRINPSHCRPRASPLAALPKMGKAGQSQPGRSGGADVAVCKAVRIFHAQRTYSTRVKDICGGTASKKGGVGVDMPWRARRNGGRQPSAPPPAAVPRGLASASCSPLQCATSSLRKSVPRSQTVGDFISYEVTGVIKV